jgi:4-hydroxybenzoyl-CoA thioesterase
MHNVATRIEVSFGDCDPAGIVFYPRYFAWADRTFHDYLRPMGGHASICRNLNAVGIGLIAVEARFRRPVRDGDVLVMACRAVAWSERNVTIEHVGTVDEQVVVKVNETRGVFCLSENGIFASETIPFRRLVDEFDQGRE